MDNILIQAGAAGLFANMLVSLLRLQSTSIRGWKPPALAILIGMLAAFLLRIAVNDAVTWQLGAQSILAGFLAGAGAITSATLHTKVAEDRQGPTFEASIDGVRLDEAGKDQL